MHHDRCRTAMLMPRLCLSASAVAIGLTMIEVRVMGVGIHVLPGLRVDAKCTLVHEAVQCTE